MPQSDLTFKVILLGNGDGGATLRGIVGADKI